MSSLSPRLFTLPTLSPSSNTHLTAQAPPRLRAYGESQPPRRLVGSYVPGAHGLCVRFSLVLDISRGLVYLHRYYAPPVIYGDIKPSNVLIGCDFKAKIGDLGLARVKSEDPGEKRKEATVGGENGSTLEETESVVSGYEESAVVATDRSLESFAGRVFDSEASPDTSLAMSPELGR